MALLDRIATLRARHTAIQHEIDKETNRPLPNAAVIAALKRRKLRLKDELAALERGYPVVAGDRG